MSNKNDDHRRDLTPSRERSTEPLPAELEQVAQLLAGKAPRGEVPDRDLLMYRCGQAAANAAACEVHRGKWLGSTPALGWSAVIVALALAALAGYRLGQPSDLRAPRRVAGPSDSPPPAADREQPARPRSANRFSRERVEEIDSGQYLFAGMMPEQLDDVINDALRDDSTANPNAGRGVQERSLRAGAGALELEPL